jgi:MoaA/NifB/PqqE/SkfB family radical SAM enzyme
MMVKLNYKLIKHVMRWYFHTYILNKPFPLISVISLTHKCNLNCRFCNLGPKSKRKTMPFELFKEIVENLKDIGTYYLEITGGEPLIVNNIIDYISYAKQKIPFVQVTTNGSLIDKKMAKNIGKTKLNAIFISIDALKKKNDENRGKSGTFIRAIRAIRLLKKYSPNTTIFVNTMLAPWNIEDQIELRKICKELEVEQRYLATIYHPELQGKVDKKEICCSMSQIKKVDFFIENLKGNDINKNYLKLLNEYYKYLFQNKEFNLKHSILNQDCLLPLFFITISETGCIYSCDGFEKINKFSLKNSSLKYIISKKDWKKEIEKLKKCRKCRNLPVSCYIQPRLNFPIKNFIKYSLISQ